jgi:hypothetical protein
MLSKIQPRRLTLQLKKRIREMGFKNVIKKWTCKTVRFRTVEAFNFAPRGNFGPNLAIKIRNFFG